MNANGWQVLVRRLGMHFNESDMAEFNTRSRNVKETAAHLGFIVGILVVMLLRSFSANEVRGTFSWHLAKHVKYCVRE